MKQFLLLLICITMLYGVHAQSFTVTYDFTSDLSGTVTGEQAVTADNLIPGGSKQTLEEVLNDNGTSAFKAHIKNNNATDYTFSRVRMDIHPKDGYRIVINEIKFTQRSSIAGEAGKSQTYLFRIGCSKNGVLPQKDNTQQSTKNTLFYDTYKADAFTPGADFNTVGGEDFFSAFATARGKSTSNDEFDWFIDKVEITGTAVKLLSLPTFSVTYGFDGASKTPVIDGDNITASDMTAKSNTEGITTSGLYWIKTNNNTNTIGYKLMGLKCDITPSTGYEVVMKDYSITHAGSGEVGASRVNRIGLYRDISRDAAGVEIKKVDFVEEDYAGRDIYGDAVATGKFKTNLVEDNVVFDAQHFFTFSVNRTGAPGMSEYWTVDEVIFNGWIVPSGRGTMLNYLIDGQELLLGAIIGTEPGEYQQSVYDDFKNLLVTANDTLNNPATTLGVIDAYTTQLADAVAAFPSQAIGANATLAVDTTSGHEIMERMHGYNSRLADEGWSFRNPELLKAMDTLGIGWLRYLSGTRNNGFNMNIGMYEPEDIEQLIEFDDLPGGNIECHKRIEVKGPQLVDDLYQALGENNARLVVTWSGFIGEPWEAALFAKFCEDNHIEVDLWQFVNEPYFHNPNRHSWFWNNGADYIRKMHPIADSIKAYDPDAIMAPNSSWDNPKETFSQQVADYTPRFFNAFSKHSYAAYNTDMTTPIDQGIKQLIGGVYFGGTESYQRILDVYGNDIPVYVTEYQTWNNVTSSFIMSGIYVSEYILRMAAHPNTKLIAKHSFNSAVKTPISNHKTTIDNAYNNNTTLNTDALVYGVGFTVEGLAQKVVNDGINHCTYVYDGTITGDATVDADNKNTTVKELPALYSGVYDGTNGKRYIIITNKSDITHNLTVTGLKLPATVDMHYVMSYSPSTKVDDLEIKTRTVNSDAIVIEPYSVTRIEWLHQVEAPSASRIFDVKVGDGQASLKWWTKQNADSYMVYYGTDANTLDQS
ncbi:MAG: hypothetical protein MI922_08925, partial [Bacteroidales bacterium]|nr:hypothetical protein [Bacteroidales bacterium]